MLNRVVNLAAGVAAISGILFSNPNQAAAVSYDLTGGFVGELQAQFEGGENDWFHTILLPGSKFEHNGNLGVLTINASGIIKDTQQSNSETVGSINLQFSYFWNTVETVSLNQAGAVDPNGKDYALSLTPDGQGNGAGLIGNISITAANQSDSATFQLNAKPYPGGLNFDPLNQYLGSIDQQTYFALGDLFNAGTGTGIDAGSILDFASWFMSGIFNLSLGDCRTGDYLFVADVAARANPGTEVPEPASMALLSMGLLGGVVARKRRAE